MPAKHTPDQVVQAFWDKVDQSGECWVWTAAASEKGYGHFAASGRQVKAHRFAYELSNGPIESGACVLHRCDNPPCVRPSHMFIGTRADNNADMYAKGRKAVGDAMNSPKGEKCAAHKLTEFEVLAIRNFSRRGWTQTALAASFGVRQSTVWEIIHGRIWKHLPA